jgi:hypothetical protein
MFKCGRDVGEIWAPSRQDRKWVETPAMMFLRSVTGAALRVRTSEVVRGRLETENIQEEIREYQTKIVT